MSNCYFSAAEGLVFVAALTGLGGLVGLGELLRAVGTPARITRHLVHSGVSLFVAATPVFFSRPFPVYVLAGLFVVLNAAARAREWWAGIHEARPASWGTVALPLAVFPALAATWSIGADRVFILQASFLILAVADPLASMVGEAVGGHSLVADATWSGSGVFFGAAFVLTGGVLLSSVPWGTGQSLGVAVLVAAVVTAVEAVSTRGWDNFFIVLGVVLTLVPLWRAPAAVDVVGIGLVVGAGTAAVAYWRGALNETGAVGGGLFAASLIGLGGWAWAIPGFAFFVLSSALSWLPDPGEKTDLRGGPRRTLRQVFANGGIAWGFLGLFSILPVGHVPLRAVCYVGFLGALAAAAADTWATEVGARLSQTPRSLRTLRPVPPGTSGAVSVVGTVAAATGAGSVAGAALLVEGGTWLQMGAVVGAGLLGMAVDSLAGAFVQAHYRDPEAARLIEQPVAGSPPVRGWPGVDNDAVNAVATAVGAALAVAFTGGVA